MAMFGSKKETPAPVVKQEPIYVPEEPAAPAAPAVVRPHTLIGPGIKFTGNIEASEDIEINGRVEGNISSGNTITITEGGSIRGDIAAANLILEGVSEGNAKVKDFVKIGKAGSFTGDLVCSTLVTEDGSEFEGTLHLKKAKPEPAFFQEKTEEAPAEAAPAEEEFRF